MLVRSRAALAAVTAMTFVGLAHAAPSAVDFVAKAGASDLYEQTSSKLVLASTHDAGVRRFATEMVKDHSKSTQMVKTAALRSGLHPKPPMLDAKKQAMVADLRKAKGADRDRLYLDQQKQAHAEALSLMQDYAAAGSDAALRKAAGDIVPVVQHHIGMLNSMSH
jgi:putative membrane protein